MKMPSKTAMDVVNRFPWSANVRLDGGLVGQEYLVAEAIDLALAAEREACAQICEQAARSLIIGRRRTNQIDRHTADVLMDKARKIRERY
jgi:hypothetical protein